MNLATFKQSALVIALAISATSTNATDDVRVSSQHYISTICTLDGHWEGKFQRFDHDGVYSTWGAELNYACLPDNSIFFEWRSLIKSEGQNSYSHKVLFPNNSKSEIHLSYFRRGRAETYFFNAVNLDYRDESHWTLVREASQKVALSNPDAPVSRYTHARNGNELTISREVKNEHSSSEWRLSSRITLSAKGN